MFFVNLVFWLWLFVVPTGVLSLTGLWLYVKSHKNLPFSILISLLGVFLGIILAEYVRKKYGLDNFFGRLRATPDLDEENISNKNKAVNKDS